MVVKILKWVGNVLTIVCVIVIAVSIYMMLSSRGNDGQVPSVFGYKPMSVLSGSMEPVLKPGDMIVVKQKAPQDIKVGDIVTYWASEKMLVTHRVIEISENSGKLIFKTKGDANNVDDNVFIQADKLTGTLAFRIPYGGYVSSFTKTKAGFIILIIVPMFLIMLSELKTILSEVRKISDNNDTTSTEDNVEI